VDELPQITELPLTLLPQMTELPQTQTTPITEPPQTTELAIDQRHVPLAFTTACGEKCTPEVHGSLIVVATAAANIQVASPTVNRS